MSSSGYINIKKNENGCQQRIIGKLKECKFELFLENIKPIEKLIENISKHCVESGPDRTPAIKF